MQLNSVSANSAKNTVTDPKIEINSNNKHSKYTAAILKGINDQNEKLGQIFLDKFKSNLTAARQQGKTSIKQAAHKALNDLIRDGALSVSEVKKLTHTAWKFVYKTIKKIAPGASQNMNASAHSGTTFKRQARSAHVLDTSASTQSSQKIDAPTGFLWKPISDSAPHGLAILLPPAWTGEVEGLDILDPDSEEILASGRDGGVGNGDRQHFRFSQEGGSFPDGAIVRVKFIDGSQKYISVDNTSARVEGR